MEELLDVVDSRGEPTGRVVTRAQAHREGIPHRTSHVWIYQADGGLVRLLLQKRCAGKDSFPGCWDISSAGHIPAGQDYVNSALRELEEELGVRAKASQLVSCGMRTIVCDEVFHGIPYHDRQVTEVFALRLDGWKEADFTVQRSEIDEVRFFAFPACVRAVREHAIPHCIDLEELAMLEKADPMLHIDPA